VDANIERLFGLGKLFDKTIYEADVIGTVICCEERCTARL
jgi:hypothetical protein